MIRPVLTIFIYTVVVSSPMLFGAIAPRSPEELERSAIVIATGTVESADVSVSGTPSHSRWNLDLMVRFESFEKGADELKSGDPAEVYLWTSRYMSSPGHQGMNTVPAIGARAKFWLRKNGEGGWEPVYPNGVQLLAGESRFDFQPFEKRRKLRFGIPILVTVILGVFLLFRRLKKPHQKQ